MLSHWSEVTQLLTARATFGSGLVKAPSALLPIVFLEERSLTRAMELKFISQENRTQAREFNRVKLIKETNNDWSKFFELFD